MKKGYIPKDQRKKILLISDDLRLHSGVGNVSKDTVLSTAHHYNWVQIGGAINHPDKGKRFDLSQETNKILGIEDSSIFIYPSDGYGDPFFLRQIIEVEKPNAIFLITDPRYFMWLFNMENEIRKKIPIVYLNIWDSPFPYPYWNQPFYESCDALFGISKQTVNINKVVLGDKSEEKIFKYVPHGINTDLYFPIDENHEHFKEYSEFKNNILKGKEYDFTLFFNSRNIRRKQIPDTLLAFKLFIDKLPKEQADKCAFILHTQVVDDNGTDLAAVKEYIFGRNYPNIIFSDQRLMPQQLNYFYNMADAQILLTSNEGWGLSLTEALVTGTPIIANAQGGMIDQMRFVDNEGKWIEYHKDFPSNHRGTFKQHGEWAFPVFPSNISIQGSPLTPYISDDRCSPWDAAEQIMNVYKLSKEERKALGTKGREWALSDEAGFTAEKMGQRLTDGIDELFTTWKPREAYELINANEYKEKTVEHSWNY